MGEALNSKQHVSCGAVVYRARDGVIEVLAMHRTGTDSWHLPKGTQEPNESIEETARREILEETGYPITITRYLGSLESIIKRHEGVVPKLTHYFIAQTTASHQQQKSDSEHDTVVFLPAEKLKTLLRNKRIKNYEKEYLILEKFLVLGVPS